MRFLYYIIVVPLSMLPLWFLYMLAPLVRFVLKNVLKYRGKVIDKNLKHSFPELSEEELSKVKNAFYNFLVDMFIESLKNLSISKESLQKRLVVKNPEVMQRLFDKGKSVILAGAHMANFEFLIVGQDLLFPHQAVGIGMPLTNAFWNKKLNGRRSRFGMNVVHSGNVKEEFKRYGEQEIATLVLMDQSPGSSENAYWMNFLNQDTPVLFGAERLAHVYDQAVVYVRVKMVKRGYYEVILEEITEEPRTMRYGEITERLTRCIERDIRETPEQWLWSHNRWKKSRPEDFDERQKKRASDYQKWLDSL